MKGNQTVKEPS